MFWQPTKPKLNQDLYHKLLQHEHHQLAPRVEKKMDQVQSMFHSLEIVSTLHMFCLQNPNWTKTCVKPNTFATRSYKSILCTFNSALRAEKERRWIKFSQCSINLNVLTLPTKLKLKQKLYHTFAPRLKIRRWWLMRNWPIWTQWFHFVNWLSTSVKTISSPLPLHLQFVSRHRGHRRRFPKYYWKDWSMWLHSIGLILARIVKPISSQSTLISAVGSMTTLNPCSWMRFISTCQWFAYNESWIL